MKQKIVRGESAFNLLELLIALVVIVILAALIMPLPPSPKAKMMRISCVNNLKQIGTAYRIWENDNGDRLPSQQTISNGGWREFLTKANQGAICWTNYQIMDHEMGQSPQVLWCPADERHPGTNFFTKFGNTNISYFVGVDACDTAPQSILGGDRNLGPGSTPGRDYGFSPKNGQGNDVAVPISGPVCWSLKMHSLGNSTGAGNILMGDGSTQQTTSANFQRTWLSNAPPTTNWPAGHVPASPSIRLIFP
jgi:prepilin-type N-terminal cleavage/methylation domain-containing protein